MSLSSGDVIDGKYRIKRLLGEGGMGAVYEGENTLIHRTVAIKVLHAGVASSEEAVKRFEREAQAAGRIGSDHIVEVLDLGSLPSGDRYMVMEFLKGESLSDRIRSRGKLSAAELCPIALQMLDGLSAAHEAGIIHRDLKPDNVFLSAQSKGQVDFVKLLDFGISKFGALGTEFRMTRTGSVMGTPYYMAPEQAKGAKNMDARLDVYAAGVILFEAATGQVPFDGETFNELLFKIVMDETPRVLERVPDLDPGLAAIIDKARQKNPDDRFQSAREFREALLQWSGASPAALAAPASASALAQTAALAAPAPASALAQTAAAGRALGGHTHQAWANTAQGLPAPAVPKLGRPQKLGMLSAAVALIGAVSWLVLSEGDEAESAVAAQPVAAEAAAREAAEREKALSEERARALAAEVERTRGEMQKLQEQTREQERKTSELLAEQREQARLEAEEKAKAEKARAEQQSQASARARQRRAAAARKSSSHGSSGTTSSGRKIRTSL